MTRTDSLSLDEAWRAIDEQRLRLTDLLARLTDAQWQQQSLCAGWSVRDVAAHLTFAQARFYEPLPGLIRARGNMDRAIRDSATARASQPPEQLIATIRGMVGSRRHVQVVTHRETLIDILVHSQDIAVALGQPFDLRPEAAAFAAGRVWQKNWSWWPRKRFTGYRLVATDIDWSVGEGHTVRGPIGGLLLVLTGRNVALSQLSGPGAPLLAEAS